MKFAVFHQKFWTIASPLKQAHQYNLRNRIQFVIQKVKTLIIVLKVENIEELRHGRQHH